VLEDAQGDAFLPGAPSPGLTGPTTQYKTKEALPRNTLPVDFYSLRPADEHLPLVVMLVLTQLSAGALALDRLFGRTLEPALVADVRPLLTGAALLFGMIGLAAATLHLGRPLYMFRALLGLRTSWMSREILAFNLYFAFATPYALAVSPLLAFIPEPARTLLASSTNLLGVLATLAGAASITCSIMLYVATRREWWNGARTSFMFFGSAALLGTVTALVAAIAAHPALTHTTLAVFESLVTAIATLSAVKLAGELSTFARLRDKRQGDMKRSALLLASPLSQVVRSRVLCALFGGIAAPFACDFALTRGAWTEALVWSVIAWLLLCAGELLERFTFFAAASPPRMPGGFR
jgi:DMSO reductase anchor subunit